MDDKTFSQALKATARVACAVAVFGGVVAEASAETAARGGAAVADLHGEGPAEAQGSEEGEARVREAAEAAALEAAARGEEAFTAGPILCQILYSLGLSGGSVGCTPWGPPVPPRFTPRAERTEVA